MFLLETICLILNALDTFWFSYQSGTLGYVPDDKDRVAWNKKKTFIFVDICKKFVDLY